MTITAKSIQDAAFIRNIRALASSLLMVDDKAQDYVPEWNSCYGGSTRLPPESFENENAGLSKTDIENAYNVLAALKAWLDEAGLQRRVNLENVRVVAGSQLPFPF
jgi:hypothetical protein